MNTDSVAVGRDDETVLDTGLEYRTGEPVVVRVRHRGVRYDITDDGGAVALAGRPVGWLDVVAAVATLEGFNVNRRGVLFVPAVEGRDIDALTRRLAVTSRAAYLALLEQRVA